MITIKMENFSFYKKSEKLTEFLFLTTYNINIEMNL